MNTNTKRPVVVQMTTVPVSLNYYAGRAKRLVEIGYDVVGVSSPGSELEDFGRRERVPIHAVPMSRAISPAADAISLFRLVQLFRRLRPMVVHAHTPKADLLGSLAARAVGVPATVVSLFGLPQMTQAGWRRWVLNVTTKIACRAADLVWCDSESMRRYATDQRLCPADRATVLADGSANGVDAVDRFNPARFSPRQRHALRAEYGVPADAIVLGFVGRVVGDKGVRELAASWQTIRVEHPNTHMLLVGPWEEKDRVPAEVEQQLTADPRVHVVGPQSDIPALLALMDLFVFPSYREGCPTAVLEASAMGLPVVATNIPGCVDAVQDGVTGTLVPLRDTETLISALRGYLVDHTLRSSHGAAGRAWVSQRYRPEGVWEAVHAAYTDLLGDEAPVATTTGGARRAA